MTSDTDRVDTSAEVLALAEEVVRLLADHCGAYEDLRVLHESQTEALRHNDLQRLQKILLGQDEILAGVVAREEARRVVGVRMEGITGFREAGWERLGREFAVPR